MTTITVRCRRCFPQGSAYYTVAGDYVRMHRQYIIVRDSAGREHAGEYFKGNAAPETPFLAIYEFTKALATERNKRNGHDKTSANGNCRPVAAGQQFIQRRHFMPPKCTTNRGEYARLVAARWRELADRWVASGASIEAQ